MLVALIFRTLDALRIFDLPFVLTKGAHGTTTLSLIAYQTFQTEPHHRAGLGARGADVHDRDDRVVRLHPLRRRQHPRPGGGLDDGSRKRPRRKRPTAPSPGRRRRRRGAGGRPPWWMWVAVAAIVLFCLFPFYWLVNISLKTGPDLSTAATWSRPTRRSTTTSRSSRTTTSCTRCATARSSACRHRRSWRWSWARSAAMRWRG